MRQNERDDAELNSNLAEGEIQKGYSLDLTSYRQLLPSSRTLKMEKAT